MSWLISSYLVTEKAANVTIIDIIVQVKREKERGNNHRKIYSSLVNDRIWEKTNIAARKNAVKIAIAKASLVPLR